MNDKKPLFFLLVIAAAFALGLSMGAMAGISVRREGRELRERLEQVTGDLNSAIESQREAAGRAAVLQTELQGLTDHARSLEARALSIEARSGSLAEQLDGIIDQSGELTDRISRANDSLEESRILLDELGTLIRSIP